MTMITYKQKVVAGEDVTQVVLGNKIAGVIKYVGAGNYQYFPKGSNVGGEICPSIGWIKHSLEAGE